VENIRKHDISFLGEFVDKALEEEFFDYDMKRYAKFIGPVSLIFGAIYMMFLISDYFAIKNPFSFMVILIVRTLFIVMSVVIYLAVKKINDYTKLAYLITVYEVLAIIGFLVIIEHYKSLTLLLFFSVMAITLAIYIIPNKLIYSQIISVLLSLTFFIFYAKHIEGIEASVFLKMVAYNFIIIIYCNIGAYLTNYYKRKQFIDSRELLRVSITDSLTGIYNRAKFNDEINQWIDYCNRYETPLSLVMLDIDNFKRVNDCYGHLIGDSVIQNIASTIKKAIRNADIFARWGGEEFAILLPNTDIHQTMEMMERVRICIQNSKYNKVENITCSFGLVTLRKNENAESLLQRVDKLLYIAKDAGKNAVVGEDGELYTLQGSSIGG
jgi:diguanylate cyclase (GGDEF)-like protein